MGIQLSINQVLFIRKRIPQCRRLRLTLVARRRDTLRVQALRESFCRAISTILIPQLVFVDETHVDRRDLCRRYGYFQPGFITEVRQHHLTRESFSVIVGITERMIFPVLIKSTGEVDFLLFLEHIHPFLRTYHALVMDNTRIHRSMTVESWLNRPQVGTVGCGWVVWLLTREVIICMFCFSTQH